jgi:hypothetical protein
MADITIYEGIAYILAVVAGGGGLYGKQKLKERKNGASANTAPTVEPLTEEKHAIICAAHIAPMQGDIENIKKDTSMILQHLLDNKN